MRSKLRPYQREALDWALRIAETRGGAVVCLPTGTGKTLVAVSFAEQYLHNLRSGEKVLVLEPTRFLVEQTAKRFRYEGFSVSMIHSGVKERDWNRSIVVATPESALSYFDHKYGGLYWEKARELASKEFPIVIIDECHHTVGRDPFAVVMNLLSGSIKLGLSALVPSSRISEIEEYIGIIRKWSFNELEGKGYEKPYMIAEVYESPFRQQEEELYVRLYNLWLSGGPYSNFAALALTTLSRDGSDALLDSAAKPTAFARFLSEAVPNLDLPQEPHKFPVLQSILRDYDGNYTKALVFVNRRCTAELIAENFKHLNPVKIIGGREAADPETRRSLLEEAKKPETKLIIATSAGDEGIDVPEVDLVIFWSHVSSPLRLYQRLGRALRPAPGKVKYAVFVVTPGTRDYDALPESLVALAREGIDVSGIFDDVESPILGEGIVMARKVREISQTLGVKGLHRETLLSTLISSQWAQKAKRRIAAELDESVKMGAILYYYDVEEVYSEIQSWVESGVSELYLTLGPSHRRYLAIDEADEAVKNYPENFLDGRLCFDPFEDFRIKGANEKNVHSLVINLVKLLSSGAKATQLAEVFSTLAGECPTAIVKWRIKLSDTLFPVNGKVLRLSVTAEYGPYMVRSVKQIVLSMRNTAAIWNLITQLVNGSEGMGYCDRLLRAASGSANINLS
ncbi:MAG: DEAD/DEAH box helicase [Thermofilaceae archaeon]